MNTNIEISHITKNTRTALPPLMMSTFVLAAVFLACWDTMVPENYADEGIGYGINPISRHNPHLRF